MWSRGSFDIERRRQAEVNQEVKDSLIVVGTDFILGFAAPGRHQKEDAPESDALDQQQNQPWMAGRRNCGETLSY